MQSLGIIGTTEIVRTIKLYITGKQQQGRNEVAEDFKNYFLSLLVISTVYLSMLLFQYA